MADGDYERRDRRVAEIKRLEGILRAAKVSIRGGESHKPEGLRSMRDVVEDMARKDRG